jgi:uncharacterized RDD family membrane protein YckC
MTETLFTKYQTFSQRLGAGIIDGIVFLPLLFLMPANADKSIFWVVFQNGLYLIYSIVGHHKFGQTLGKRLTFVKVVQSNDETKLLSLMQAFKRDIISIIFVLAEVVVIAFNLTETSFGEIVLFFGPFVWFIAEIVTMLFNNKRRSVHDFIANSVCIDITKKI